ncbi:MAG TPA: IS982 family transposase [Candidatus Saccharimonadia bacterium]|nr:IS982 family transposase [Candidatus Saccharimonadia bacterium]
MLSVQPHHIVDVFYFVDNNVPEPVRRRGGRPKLVRDSEIITLLIWNCLSSTRQRTLKDVFRWALLYHRRDVPNLGTYGSFVAHCHRLVPRMVELLGQLLVPAEIQFIDSTKLPVCRNHRTGRYRVAKKLASVGKNWQGYWYGFKLHLAINGAGRISALAFTPADVYDGHVTEQLVRAETKIVVGDSHYGDKIQRAKLKAKGITVVAPPHWRHKTRLMARWQQELLCKRAKVETTFDRLKEHLPLVSSFPRSVNGYLLHYVRILLGYQMEVGF